MLAFFDIMNLIALLYIIIIVIKSKSVYYWSVVCVEGQPQISYTHRIAMYEQKWTTELCGGTMLNSGYSWWIWVPTFRDEYGSQHLMMNMGPDISW